MMNHECERRLLTRSSRLSCTLMAALFAAVVGIGGGAVSVLHADDSDIVITEILYHPGTLNTGGEFIEIHNAGATPVELDGWVFTDGIDFTFPNDTSIEPDGYLVIAQDEVAAAAFYGVSILGQFTGRLSDEDDVVVLEDFSLPRQVIDVVSYDDDDPWPDEPDGSGPSLELTDPALPNFDVTNWALGQPFTPGAPNNSTAPGGGDIAISEIQYKPLWRRFIRSVDPIAGGNFWKTDDETTGEFVEFYNRGTEQVDLSGWKLIDDDGLLFEFPETTSLDSGAYLVVAADAAGVASRYGIDTVVGQFSPGLGLADGGELLTLLDEFEGVVDSVRYDDRRPWSVAPDQEGVSLECLDPTADNSTAANWRSARLTPPPPPGGVAVGTNNYLDLGTPGADNTVSSNGVPPLVNTANMLHVPLRPTSLDDVTISAPVSGHDPITSVELFYQVLQGSYQNVNASDTVAMSDDATNGDLVPGDGIYSVRIPARASQALVRYRITATDSAGRSWTFPDENEPNPNGAYFVYDGERDTQLSSYFLIVPNSTISTLNSNNWTREFLEATLVAEGIVYDHVGVHYRGRGWRVHPKKSWRVSFNSGEFLRNMSKLDLAMHFATMQNLVMDIILSTGAKSLATEPVRLYRNGLFQGVYLGQESPNQSWMRARGLDPAGEVFKASGAPNYFGGGFSGNIMADLDHFANPDVYPDIWEKKGDRLGSFDTLIAFTDVVANTAEEGVFSAFEENIDLDAWLYHWSVNVAGANVDIIGTNYLVFKPANDKWQMRSFDFSHFFGCQMLDFQDVVCHPFTLDPYRYFNHFHRRVIDNPDLRARFLVILDDVLRNYMSTPKLNALIDDSLARTEEDRNDELQLRLPGPGPYVVSGSDPTQMKSYMTQRRTWLLNTFLPQEGFVPLPNAHPTIDLNDPALDLETNVAEITWQWADDESDPSTVSLFWTDKKWNFHVPIPGAESLPATDLSFTWLNPVLNGEIYIHAEIDDGVSSLIGRDTSLVPISVPPLNAPTDLVCTKFAAELAMTWINNDDYDTLTIVANGNQVANLPTDAENYESVDLPPGFYTYQVIATGRGDEKSVFCQFSVHDPADQIARLTGINLFKTDESGEVNVSERWNTLYLDEAWDLGVYEGPPVTDAVGFDSARWLNDPTDLTLDFEIAACRQRTFTFHAGRFFSFENYFGINLFFDGSEESGSPAISAVAFSDADGPGGNVEPFVANGASETMGWPSLELTPGAATLTYHNPNLDVSVTLTDFSVYPQTALNVDLGSNMAPGNRQVTEGPDGLSDLIGQFTVRVEVTDGNIDCDAEPQFIRGDSSADGLADISDAIISLEFLFLGTQSPTCEKSVDVDDSGLMDLNDPISLLEHLFLGDPAPSAPYPGCGVDPSEDGLSCEEFAPCEA